jgi:hypothetical protein
MGPYHWKRMRGLNPAKPGGCTSYILIVPQIFVFVFFSTAITIFCCYSLVLFSYIVYFTLSKRVPELFCSC